VVACQPAVQLSVFLLVTRDAKTHLEVYRPQPVHGLYLAVAIGAVQLTPNDVRLVIELYVVRHVIDLNPRHRGVGVVMLPFFNNLRVLGNDVVVAEKTFLHCRESRPSGTIDKRMAEAAVDLFDSGMHPVAEINRLLRTDPPIRINVVEIQHCGDQYGRPGQPQTPPYSVTIMLFDSFSHRPLLIHHYQWFLSLAVARYS